MRPDKWRDAWEHRVINARSDDRLLPAAALQFLLSHGMPKVVIFEWHNGLEISFSPLSGELVVFNTLVRWGDFYDEARDRE
jgi:hypothetical protein